MGELAETAIDIGGTRVVTLQGGSGRPLLMLHDELGFPGWMRWDEDLAESHRFVIPLQRRFGSGSREQFVKVVSGFLGSSSA